MTKFGLVLLRTAVSVENRFLRSRVCADIHTFYSHYKRVSIRNYEVNFELF